MSAVRRRRPLAEPGRRSAEPPPAESWRLHATLIGALPRLRRYATAWLGNAAAADDLVGEVIERALAQADPSEEPQRAHVRLLRLLHDVHQDGPRRARHDAPLGLYSLSRELPEAARGDDGPRMEALADAIEQLSNEHREALLLVALEGLSYRDVADVLGLPLGTVMSRLAGARAELLALTGGRAATVAGRSEGGIAARSGVSELDLHAHLDGELGTERAGAVKAFLQARPKQSERLKRLAEQEDMIRKLYGPLLNRTVPPELLTPLLAPAVPRVEPRRWPRRATAAVAVGLLVLGFVAGWLLRSYFTPAGIVVPWLAP